MVEWLVAMGFREKHNFRPKFSVLFSQLDNYENKGDEQMMNTKIITTSLMECKYFDNNGI